MSKWDTEKDEDRGGELARGIYDYISEDKRKKELFHDGTYNLVIDPTKDNPVDNLLVIEFKVAKLLGRKFHPALILDWFVIAESDKKIEGTIIDIFPTRDLLIKTDKGNVPVAFEDVVLLRRNKP